MRYTVQYCVGGSALPHLRRDGAHPFPHLRRDRSAAQCADGCLFDVSADPAEHADLAADQAHAVGAFRSRGPRGISRDGRAWAPLHVTSCRPFSVMPCAALV